MFERNWRTILKIGGFVGVAAVGYLLVVWLLAHSAHLEQRAANYSDEYTQNSEYRIKNVCPSTISEPDCVDQANEAAREAQRKEQDLAAQNVTAWWTKVMGFAALVGMALSAVGVWLVKTTFEETQRANEIAQRSAHDQLRAYIAQQTMTVKRQRPKAGHVRFKGSVYIKNYGQTPAYDVWLTGQIYLREEQPKEPVFTFDHAAPQIIGPQVGWQMELTKEYPLSSLRGKRLWMVAEVRYRDFSGRFWKLRLANGSVKGGSITQLNCCKEGNYESELSEMFPTDEGVRPTHLKRLKAWVEGFL